VPKKVKEQRVKEKSDIGSRGKQMRRIMNRYIFMLDWYIFTRRIKQVCNIVYTRLGLDTYYRRGGKGSSG
jgi:hypothetical protein